MSELKWNWAYFPYLDASNKQKEYALKAGYIKVVSKDEADKVIAELKAENESLLQQNRELCQALHVMYSKEEYDKQKYKRCMAMKYVEWLKQIIIGLHPESILYRKAFKRERKWKELAEKFKEAK